MNLLHGRPWLRLAGAHLPDRLVAAAGAALCLALTVLLCAEWRFEIRDLPVIVAPLGASAVLAFAVPSSPLAQPWALVGGNVVSALVGVAMARLVPGEALAAGLAVGGAILAMSLLRCLHPPGGAAALTAVIGGQAIHAAGYSFALVPVGINSVALAALAVLYHRLSGHSYPHRPALVPPAPPVVQAEAGLLLEDIDRALDDAHESFDIAREDLALLLAQAEVHAARRRAAQSSISQR